MLSKVNNISISTPFIGKEEISNVLKVLKSKQLAQGRMVEQFEQVFAEYIGTKFAVATSNGTTALFLSLKALDLDENTEVITTPFTFIATANIILHAGLKPVFVDIDQDTFNLNPNLIEQKITNKTRAILPVHLYGQPADMIKIKKIAKKNNLKIIEDACQAHGAEYFTKKVGSLGDLGCFSFYPTKNMTTSEGGIVTTDNEKLAEKIKILRNQGMSKQYQYEQIGYNFRMTDIQAAIGLAQIKKLISFNKKRVANAEVLTKALKTLVITPKISPNVKHVFHQYTIKVPSQKRDYLKKELFKKNISAGVYYPSPITQTKPYLKLGYGKESFPITEKVCNEVLSLPIHPQLTKQDLKTIIDSVKEAM